MHMALPEWWPIFLGILVLYIPTIYDLFSGLWVTEEQMHGPIILLLAIWLMLKKLHGIKDNKNLLSFVIGWGMFVSGLLLYIMGRSQQIIQFELGSFILILAALLSITRGSNALKAMWFPLFFLLFMIPLPGTVVIVLTMPMKMAASYATENILFWTGYPIARNGVTLQIGQYQLLVADACAGLQTLLTLEALGLFYLNIVHHSSVFRNVMLATLIVPISFIANVIRVSILTLITYHFGEDAGQGFLHEFSGIALFLSALILIMGTDRLLQFIAKISMSNTLYRSRSL